MSLYWKYIIGHFLAPFSLLFFILFTCFIWILFKPTARTAKLIMGLTLLTLYGFSTPFIAERLLTPLERQYGKFAGAAKPVDYIVVLGCAHQTQDFLPQSSILDPCSQIRVHEALLVYQRNPEAQVIFTGGGNAKQATLAASMANFGKTIGINPQHIILEQRPYNTEQETAHVSTLVRDSTVVLVTAAAHMPRAMYLFSKHHITPIPAPTDFQVRGVDSGVHLRYFIPEVSNLHKVNIAAHEYYGLWWIDLNEWLSGA